MSLLNQVMRLIYFIIKNEPTKSTCSIGPLLRKLWQLIKMHKISTILILEREGCVAKKLYLRHLNKRKHVPNCWLHNCQGDVRMLERSLLSSNER